MMITWPKQPAVEMERVQIQRDLVVTYDKIRCAGEGKSSVKENAQDFGSGKLGEEGVFMGGEHRRQSRLDVNC